MKEISAWFWVALALALVFVVTASGAEPPLPDLPLRRITGVVEMLREVRLMRVEPDGIRVMHATGMAKVPVEQLPAEVAARYGLSQAGAEAFRAGQERAAKASEVPQERVAAPSPAVTPSAEPPRLWTRQDVLAVWLANCDPARIPALDRDLAKKREACAQRAKSIRAGKLNVEAEIAAREANARILAQAGDSAGVAVETAAAQKARAASAAAARRLHEMARESTLINGRPPLYSVGGGASAP